jgi:hypothetical protein
MARACLLTVGMLVEIAGGSNSIYTQARMRPASATCGAVGAPELQRLACKQMRLRGGSDEAEEPVGCPDLSTDELSEDEREVLAQYREVERQYVENEMTPEVQFESIGKEYTQYDDLPAC